MFLFHRHGAKVQSPAKTGSLANHQGTVFEIIENSGYIVEIQIIAVVVIVSIHFSIMRISRL